MYQTTAHLYDTIAAMEDPAPVRDTVTDLLAGQGFQPPALIGDLGCGTGVMALLLAEAGWRIHGIELSDAMLNVARHKLQDHHLPVTLTQGDITAFTVDEAWDAAICMHNTVNHLPELAHVKAMARCVFAALKPGGLLVFDADTEKTFTDFFDHEPTEVWSDGKQRLLRACTYDPATGRADHAAVIETHDGEQWQTTSEETMQLQHYSEQLLHAIFTTTGFHLLDARPHNPSPQLYQGFIPKTLWVLKKTCLK